MPKTHLGNFEEKKAKEAGIETAADFFRESSKDNGRHYKILEGYF